MIDEGLYAGTILHHSVHASKGGKVYLSFLFSLANGKSGEAKLYVTPDAVEITKKTLERLGLPLELPAYDERFEGFYSLVGKRLVFRCTHKHFRDELQENWNLYSSSESLASPMEMGQANRLLAA